MTRSRREGRRFVWSRRFLFLFSVPISIFIFILSWIMFTGVWDVPLIGGLIASGSVAAVEVAAYLLWYAGVPATRGDPAPGHDDWMKEGGV